MMTQTRLESQGNTPFVPFSQPDGYQKATKNWKVNTGFKKLQKRIVDRQRSGKSQTLHKALPVLNQNGNLSSSRKSGGLTSLRVRESTSALTTSRPFGDVTDKEAKRKDSKLMQSRSMLWHSVATSGSKTRGLEKREGPSEFSTSLQYELYRTSNNGLARISARMKKNAFKLPSQTSLDFSDSLSFEHHPEKSPEQQQKLPVITKSNPALLKAEVAKLDSRYEADFEEELEERIVKWIDSCKLWEAFDGQPYADLDRKQRKSSSKTHVTSTLRSKVTDTPRGLDRSKTCL